MKAPPSMDVLGETSGIASNFGEPETPILRTADLVINGALVEAKLFIYGKVRESFFRKSNFNWLRSFM
jgi:vacuolar protein sorting-associated protein 13A/C